MRTLKIKKVDDKPMVIHTKEKAKIHTVQSKELSIKGRNVLSRENVPKIKGATVNASSLKESQKYRKATKYQAGKDETCANRNVNQKQGIQKAKDSIRKKDSNLKYVGLAGAKTATTAATTAAGTALAPGVGTAIGVAAGYVAGVAVEQKDMQVTNRNRKIKFFLDKMNAQDKQTDSIAKLVKDLLVKRGMTMLKQVAPIIGIAFLAMALIIAIAAIPVVAVVGILYNSPFAIFLPPFEFGDTVMSVTSAYVADFNRDVNTLASEHTGYDYGDIIYVGYEDSSSSPSNYYDIMCVYGKAWCW